MSTKKVKRLEDLETEFFDQVNYQGRIVRPDLGHCFDWLGPRSHVYGGFKFEFKGRVFTYTHQYVYALKTGLMPPTRKDWPEVLKHECDNTLCCNPDHIRRGTQTDNLKEMWARGRGKKGRTLTEADVWEILESSRRGEAVPALSKRFDVHQMHIYGIRGGRYYYEINQQFRSKYGYPSTGKMFARRAA
jgi:hypothetical protein